MTVRISVLVNWYFHGKYAEQALASVLNQHTTYDFEVLILTPDPHIELSTASNRDASSRGIRVLSVEVPRGPVGVGLVRGLEQARGDVLALLDDDDTWEVSKLQAVGEAFEDPRIVYFHNAQTFIDSQDRPLSVFNPHRLIRHPSSLDLPGRYLIVDASDPLSVSRVRPLEPDFNNSSVSVRRSLLTRHPDVLARVDRGEDTFLYYSALASRNRLLLTTDRLTRYRVHPGGVTASRTTAGGIMGELASYADLAEKQFRRLQLVEESMVGEAIPEVGSFLRSDQAVWATLWHLATGRDSAPTRALRLRALLGDRYARPRPREVCVVGLETLSTLAPWLTRVGFAAWRRVW